MSDEYDEDGDDEDDDDDDDDEWSVVTLSMLERFEVQVLVDDEDDEKERRIYFKILLDKDDSYTVR